MLIRQQYINYISSKLGALFYEIKARGKLNLLELNIYSEDFFADLLNLIYGYSLTNLNRIKANSGGVDLIDTTNRIVMQVSATGSKSKIEHSLSRTELQQYAGFHFVFVLLSEEEKSLRKKSYNNPYGLCFDPSIDIYDFSSILKKIESLSTDDVRIVYDFIRKELESDISIPQIDTNLAMIINALSVENLSVDQPNVDAFDIYEKIDFNDLITRKSTIDNYKIYSSKISEKYKEYDSLGKNKSLSILNSLHSIYVQKKEKASSAAELFDSIIEEVCSIVMDSRNYTEIPWEELEMCVSIVVVDAFMRCKIFENPEGYNYVASR